MTETTEQYGPSPLLQPYSGKLTTVIDGIGVGIHNYTGDDSTLWNNVGAVYAEHTTSLRRPTVCAFPDDFEIVFFSPETKLLQVRMLRHWKWDGYDDYYPVPGLPDLSNLGEDDDEWLDHLCECEEVDPDEIWGVLGECLSNEPNMN